MMNFTSKLIDRNSIRSCSEVQTDEIVIDQRSIPRDLFKEIFSYLSFEDLLKCSQVNKKEWREVGNDPLLLKKVIWQEKAFSPKDWALHFGDDCKGANESEESWKKLPADIAKIFKSPCHDFSKKKLGEVYDIVWVPAGMTINNYGDLLKQKFPQNQKGYGYLWNEIATFHGNRAIEKSEWIFISKKAIYGGFFKRIEIVNSSNSKDRIFDTIPMTLEAIICVSATIFKADDKIYRNYCIKCREETLGLRNVVSFSPIGIVVDYKN